MPRRRRSLFPRPRRRRVRLFSPPRRRRMPSLWSLFSTPKRSRTTRRVPNAAVSTLAGPTVPAPRRSRADFKWSAGSVGAATVLILACCIFAAIGLAMRGTGATDASTQQVSQSAAPTDTPASTATSSPPTPALTSAQATATECGYYRQPPPGCSGTGGNGGNCTAVNCNPWGYDFNPGNLIDNPPSAFCSYFACIPSFGNGNGYVMECADSMFSKSGGIQGSCSRHGGDWRPLYSH